METREYELAREVEGQGAIDGREFTIRASARAVSGDPFPSGAALDELADRERDACSDQSELPADRDGEHRADDDDHDEPDQVPHGHDGSLTVE